jgi:hypothetical protein
VSWLNLLILQDTSPFAAVLAVKCHPPRTQPILVRNPFEVCIEIQEITGSLDLCSLSMA